MLINTLYAILSELLPLGILITLMLLNKPYVQLTAKQLLLALVSGVLLSSIIIPLLSSISRLFDYTGLELFFFGLSLMQYLLYFLLCLQITAISSKSEQFISLAILTILCLSVSVNLSNYLVASYQTHDQYSLLLGTMVAVGICISLSTLLFFMLSPLTRRLSGLSWLMVCIFLSSQVASKTNLLAQINLLESREIWSTQDFLSDHSIVAYFLKSLLGYEATPIAAQVITYIAALVLIISVTLIRGVFRTNLNAPGEEVINVSN